MLHACVERFDVIGRRENILGWDEKVNKAYILRESDGREQSVATLMFEENVGAGIYDL
jgi:hypothetical protein